MSRSPERRKDGTGEVIQEGLDELPDKEGIMKYKPQFLGYGGEHVVFSFPGKDRIVGKVHKATLEGAIRKNIEDDRPIDALPEGVTDEKMKEFLDAERQRHRVLKAYFDDHVLAEKPYLMQVPVNKKLLEASIDFDVAAQVPDGVHDAWALVRVQEKAPAEAVADGALSTAFRYREQFELGEHDRDWYKRLNAVLLDGTAEFTSDLHDDGSGLVYDIVEKMKDDEGLRDQVRDFTRRAIEYSTDTGELLDLAGKGNVTFYQKDGQWQYTLLDAKYPDAYVFASSKEIVKTFLAGETLNKHELNRAMNALNYVRTLNALAIETGLDERIRLSDQPIADRTGELYDVIYAEYGKKPRHVHD